MFTSGQNPLRVAIMATLLIFVFAGCEAGDGTGPYGTDAESADNSFPSDIISLDNPLPDAERVDVPVVCLTTEGGACHPVDADESDVSEVNPLCNLPKTKLITNTWYGWDYPITIGKFEGNDCGATAVYLGVDKIYATEEDGLACGPKNDDGVCVKLQDDGTLYVFGWAIDEPLTLHL